MGLADTPDNLSAGYSKAWSLSSSFGRAKRGGSPAPGHDADHASRAGRIEAEQRRLIQWAKENGKLGSWRSFAGGGAHNVFVLKTHWTN